MIEDPLQDVFLSGGISISWCSKKQNSVSLSTTEAEYKAAAQESFGFKDL